MNTKHAKSAVWTLSAALAVLLAVPAAQAYGGHHGPGPDGDGKWGGGQRLMEALDLTDEQVEQLKDHRLKQHKERINLRAEMATLKVDLAEALDEDKIDRGKVERLAKRIGEQHAKQILLRAEGVEYMRDVLTPEQLKKWKAGRLLFGGPGMHGDLDGKGHRGKGRK